MTADPYAASSSWAGVAQQCPPPPGRRRFSFPGHGYGDIMLSLCQRLSRPESGRPAQSTPCWQWMLAWPQSPKAKPLGYLETHAGRGLRPPRQIRKTGEAQAGITRALAPGLAACGPSLAPGAGRYPRRHGATAYRIAADRGISCVPATPPIWPNCTRPNIRGAGPMPVSRISTGRTGLRWRRPSVPPTPRRGLLLIDPAMRSGRLRYHSRPDCRAGAKWNVGTIALWYPVLTDDRQAAMVRTLTRDHPDALLSGCGFRRRSRGTAWSAQACSSSTRLTGCQDGRAGSGALRQAIGQRRRGDPAVGPHPRGPGGSRSRNAASRGRVRANQADSRWAVPPAGPRPQGAPQARSPTLQGRAPPVKTRAGSITSGRHVGMTDESMPARCPSAHDLRQQRLNAAICGSGKGSLQSPGLTSSMPMLRNSRPSQPCQLPAPACQARRFLEDQRLGQAVFMDQPMG